MHDMRMVTGEKWAIFGAQCHPRNADCRGGVFAVFAKIPPSDHPILHTHIPCPPASPLDTMIATGAFWGRRL